MGMFSFCLYIGLQKGFCQIDGIHYNYLELNFERKFFKEETIIPTQFGTPKWIIL